MFRKFLNRFKISQWELAGDFSKLENEFSKEWEQKISSIIEQTERSFWTYASKIEDWIHRSKLLFILTAPFIYSLWVPAVLMDALITLYQKICFPVYGIPRVERKEYIVIDRHRLTYLSGLEKFNCLYCGYFNGLIAYVREIASRTEQYWCPIKHAKKLKDTHERYKRFVEYGDRKSYRQNLSSLKKLH